MHNGTLMGDIAIPLVISVAGSLIATWITGLATRIKNRRVKIETGQSGNMQIDAETRSGPTSFKHGFTQAAVEVNITNRHRRERLVIRDLRLMLNRDYGAPVLPTAPPGRSHPELPFTIEPGTTVTWHFPAEHLSNLLKQLYHPPSKIVQDVADVPLYIRCIRGTGKVYKRKWFKFTTDQNAHWPNPPQLQPYTVAARFYRALAEKWATIAALFAVILVVVQFLRGFGILLP